MNNIRDVPKKNYRFIFYIGEVSAVVKSKVKMKQFLVVICTVV